MRGGERWKGTRAKSNHHHRWPGRSVRSGRAGSPERSPVSRYRWCRGHDRSGCEWCRRKPVGVPLVAVGGLEAVPPLVDRRGTGPRRGEPCVVAPPHARGRSSRCMSRSPEGEAGSEGQTEDGRQVDPKHGCAPASPADPTAPLNTPLRTGARAGVSPVMVKERWTEITKRLKLPTRPGSGPKARADHPVTAWSNRPRAPGRK